MSSWIVPKFAWHTAGGLQTFTPTYPPIDKDVVPMLAASRYDSITSSGLKQSVLERIDQLISLNFQFVPQADLAGWTTFMTYALGGGEFFYHPDATNSSNVGYTLSDTDWKPKRSGFQNFAFTINLRASNPSDSGS